MSPRNTSTAIALALALALALGGCTQDGTVVKTHPALIALAVTQLDLSPPFSPEVHDYAVRCGAGPNALQLDFDATAGATVSARTPSTSGTVASKSLSVTLDEDDAIVLEASNGTWSEAYWVRCLPHDFPAITFTPHPAAGTTTAGWYLTGLNAAPGGTGFAVILDSRGTPVWYMRGAAANVTNVDRRPDGAISFITSAGMPYGMDANGVYVIQDLAPWRARTVKAVGGPTDEHELQTLPNGDVLIFSYPPVAGFDLTGLAKFGPNSTIADCTIEELDSSGKLVWSWRASDHIDPVKESLNPLTNVIGGVQVVDVYHFNSIDVDAKGNLLVSARNMSAVFYIDKASGKILWKMSGTPYSKDGAQLIRLMGDPEVAFSAQHDARFQPNGDVSLFDDHSNLSGPARGVQYAIDFSAGTAKIVWQYASKYSSQATGSFRRYSGGSNVIDWGSSKANPVSFTEVDDQGHDLLDVELGGTYRAVKLPLDAFDVNTLRTTAGHS